MDKPQLHLSRIRLRDQYVTEHNDHHINSTRVLSLDVTKDIESMKKTEVISNDLPSDGSREENPITEISATIVSLDTRETIEYLAVRLGESGLVELSSQRPIMGEL